MILGTILLYALVAGLLSWALEWVLARLGAASWFVSIAGKATLVYAFWLLLTYGPLRVGR